MDQVISEINPVAWAVAVLTVRFLMHALDRVSEAVAENGSSWYAEWPFWRTIAKLLTVTLVPVWVAVKADMNGISVAGTFGQVATGLSMSAVISELHLRVKDLVQRGKVAKLQARLDEAKEKIADLREKLQL